MQSLVIFLFLAICAPVVIVNCQVQGRSVVFYWLSPSRNIEPLNYGPTPESNVETQNSNEDMESPIFKHSDSNGNKFTFVPRLLSSSSSSSKSDEESSILISLFDDDSSEEQEPVQISGGLPTDDIFDREQSAFEPPKPIAHDDSEESIAEEITRSKLPLTNDTSNVSKSNEDNKSSDSSISCECSKSTSSSESSESTSSSESSESTDVDSFWDREFVRIFMRMLDHSTEDKEEELKSESKTEFIKKKPQVKKPTEFVSRFVKNKPKVIGPIASPIDDSNSNSNKNHNNNNNGNNYDAPQLFNGTKADYSRLLTVPLAPWPTIESAEIKSGIETIENSKNDTKKPTIIDNERQLDVVHEEIEEDDENGAVIWWHTLTPMPTEPIPDNINQEDDEDEDQAPEPTTPLSSLRIDLEFSNVNEPEIQFTPEASNTGLMERKDEPSATSVEHNEPVEKDIKDNEIERDEKSEKKKTDSPMGRISLTKFLKTFIDLIPM